MKKTNDPIEMLNDQGERRTDSGGKKRKLHFKDVLIMLFSFLFGCLLSHFLGILLFGG